MSPSRGLIRTRTFILRLHPSRYYSTTSEQSDAKTPIELLKNSPHRLHIYRSNSHNPFFNLSAEDYLLRHSPPASTILFTYTNRPSIIIGRNQNPWSEVNLPLLHSEPYSHVSLVRRRSGGGTVYHDLGNLCWSVIMPRKAFDRDINAQMVVRALHRLGVENAAVNERHDIVLKPGEGDKKGVDKKVSGSAYKIIRERSYHHATLLLNSFLQDIRKLLRSPIKDFITTKGVESVRSEVSNIGVDKDALVEIIEEEFVKMNEPKEGEVVQRVVLEEEETCRVREYITEGMEELQSSKWLFSQTPDFTITLPKLKPLPELPTLPGFQPMLPEHSKLTLLCTSSTIQNSQISCSPDPDFSFVQSQESHIRLLNTPFRGEDLNQGINTINSLPAEFKEPLGKWLEVAIGDWRGNEHLDLRRKEDGSKTMRRRALERGETRIRV